MILRFILFVSLFIAPLNAYAATATGSMNVKLVITDECKAVTASDLDFGSHGVIDANLDQTTALSLTCTSGTSYAVGLTSASSATPAGRVLTSAASGTVPYQLYRDTGRTQIWGDGAGQTIAGTGDGQAQSLTVYGRVAPMAITPATGNYTDVVTITVTY